MARHETSVLGHVETSPAEATAELRHPDLDRDLSVLIMAADRVVALRLVFVEAAERDVLWDCWVEPALPATERRALLVDLCADAVSQATAVISHREPDRSVPSDPWEASPQTWQLVAGAYRDDGEWRAAIAEMGLRHVRTFERLRLVHGLTVTWPDPPPAVTVHDVRDETDLRIAHRLNEETFSDHWGGEPPRPFPAWRDYQDSFGGFDPSRWSIASLAGEPVGFIAGSSSRDDRGIGYVPLLGVVRSARGRGIARFLLLREFARSAARGLATTELSVDSSSLTGADRLYRSVGMSPTLVIDSFLRPL